MVNLRPGSGVHRVLIALQDGDETSEQVSKTTGMPLRPSLSSYLRRLVIYRFAEKYGSIMYPSNQDGNRWKITAMGNEALKVAQARRRKKL